MFVYLPVTTTTILVSITITNYYKCSSLKAHKFPIALKARSLK